MIIAYVKEYGYILEIEKQVTLKEKV